MTHTASLTNSPKNMGTSALSSSLEEIILRYSGRGMNILQSYLDEHYCRHAAEKILSLQRGNVFLTTGFCVAGVPETDGPPGTVALAYALKKLGFTPTIITDHLCKNLFESEDLRVEYVDVEDDARVYQKLLDRYRPVCLISIERCGRNTEDDYANMRGISIAQQTACIDIMFEIAARNHILTIGIGDGGNEIGMGNLKEIIIQKLDLTPCDVTVDELIIATTSNWGAYALAAYLELLSHRKITLSFEEIACYLKKMVSKGCVDGVTKKPELSVDGFSLEVEREILTALTNSTRL